MCSHLRPLREQIIEYCLGVSLSSLRSCVSVSVWVCVCVCVHMGLWAELATTGIITYACVCLCVCMCVKLFQTPEGTKL